MKKDAKETVKRKMDGAVEKAAAKKRKDDGEKGEKPAAKKARKGKA